MAGHDNRRRANPQAAAHSAQVLKCTAMAGSFNYFNYFTEIEEHFWRKRGAHILVSPLDWAIVETWQKAGIPLEIVLRGIDRAFDSYARSRRGVAGRTLKSLAYCVDAVLDAAEEAREAAAGKAPERAAARPAADSFSRDELRAYFQRNLARLARAADNTRAAHPDLAARFSDVSRKLEEALPLLDSPARLDLQDLERRLTVLEEKLSATLMATAPDDIQLAIRREMDRALAPYRRKMSADQLAALERQYLHKRLLESFNLPRLSLFYLS